jgi:hypothetical protein
MNKITSLALATALAGMTILPATVHAEDGKPVAVFAGKSLYSADGKRLGAIYSVRKDGTIQIIIEDHLFTIKTETISKPSGQLVTSLTKAEVMASR